MKEFESRARSPEPSKTTIGTQPVDLSLQEKQDLTLWSGTPAYAAVQKLLESMMVELRDEAVLIPPHKRDERLAALDLASAAATIYTRFKEKITYLVAEHLGVMQRKEAAAVLEDQELIEAAIFDQINQGR